MSHELTVTARNEGMVAAHWENIYFPLFLRNATVESLTLMEQEEAALCRQHPQGIAVVALVPQFQLQAMPQGVRDKSAELFQTFSPFLFATATVVGGTGFFASLIRSVVAGAALVSRSRVPQKTFEQVRPAIGWVAGFDQAPTEMAEAQDALADAAIAMAAAHGLTIT